jgi:hypothetical protein
VDRGGGARALVPLALELADLPRGEAEGIALLTARAAAGAQLRGVSSSVAVLLGRARR